MSEGKNIIITLDSSKSVPQESGPRMEHFAIIVNILKFSNESVHKPNEIPSILDYYVDPKVSACKILPKINANVRDDEGKGYVEVYFHFTLPNFGWKMYVKWSGILSVMDVFGKTKFPYSFSSFYEGKFPDNPLPVLEIDKYISRETLLNNSLELLPDDCLTLRIDITYSIELDARNYDEYSLRVIDIIWSSYEKSENFSKQDYRLRQDCEVVKRLCEVSSTFQNMFDLLSFDNSAHISIPKEDFEGFNDVCYIIMGAKTLLFFSIDDVCELYRVAEKYDVQTVVETSRQLFQSFLCNENDPRILQHAIEYIPKLLEFAESYNDGYLKEIIGHFAKCKNESFGDRRTSESKKRNLEIKWTCDITSINFLRFKLSKKDEAYKEEYDFYQ